LEREKAAGPIDEGALAQLLAEDKKQDLSASWNNLGHAKTPGRNVDMKKGLTSDPKREPYQSLPSFMTYLGNRNGAAVVSEKSLADIGSEAWQFYEPPSSFKI